MALFDSSQTTSILAQQSSARKAKLIDYERTKSRPNWIGQVLRNYVGAHEAGRETE